MGPIYFPSSRIMRIDASTYQTIINNIKKNSNNASGGHMGCIWGSYGVHKGRHGNIWALSGGHLGHLGTILAVSGLHLGVIWAVRCSPILAPYYAHFHSPYGCHIGCPYVPHIAAHIGPTWESYFQSKVTSLEMQNM